MIHKTKLRSIVAALVASAAALVASAASADPFVSTPCHAGDPLCAPEELALAHSPFAAKENAAALQEVTRGKTVKRSLADRSVTAQDRSQLRALIGRDPHAGVVLMHKIPRRTDTQAKRLRKLVAAVDGFAPSGACDEIVREGTGTGLCVGTADGPVGKIPARMPVAARLDDGPDGSLHLAIWNPRALEVKALFSWSPVVSPDHLKMQIDLFPVADGWLVYTRIALDMSAHTGSAKEIADAMEKLDTWLVRELGR